MNRFITVTHSDELDDEMKVWLKIDTSVIDSKYKEHSETNPALAGREYSDKVIGYITDDTSDESAEEEDFH